MTEKMTPFQQAEEFHQTFDPRRPAVPTPFTADEAAFRAAFKIEELVELTAAAAGGDPEKLHKKVQMLHEALDKAEEKMLQKQNWGKDPLIEQADALTDILYFTYGSFSLMGVDPTRIFDIVHQANMGKLFPDGEPHYDPVTNKVLKPENWEAEYAPEPKIRQEIERQSREAQQKNQL
jgi:predicted HAD superfamily Cof-like phosphohydrolase